MRIVVPVNAANRQAEKISQGHPGAQAFHINARVAAAASIPAMLTAMTSQRAALRRSDDVVETRRAASFDGSVCKLLQFGITKRLACCPKLSASAGSAGTNPVF
jgi:hypothetical protein